MSRTFQIKPTHYGVVESCLHNAGGNLHLRAHFMPNADQSRGHVTEVSLKPEEYDCYAHTLESALRDSGLLIEQ